MALFRDGTAGLAYLLKERVGGRAELLRAARETATGRSVIEPVIVEALEHRGARRESSPLAALSPGERRG